MGMIRLTIVAYGDVTISDYRGLQGVKSLNVSAGTTRSYPLTNEQWNAMRPDVVKQSQKRIGVIVNSLPTTRTQPLMTYSVTLIPGGRPRVHQVEGTISMAGATQTVTLRGENLIQGFQAQAIFRKGLSSQITFLAARKGPVGNRVKVRLYAASGAGSVSTTPDNLGGALVEVVPAAAGPGANDIASQIAADAEATRYVIAVGGGTGTVGAMDAPLVLADGDGASMAFCDFRTLVSGSYLRVEAVAPGNTANSYSLVFSTPSGAGSVSVSGTVITVVPAAAGNTLTAVAAQINGNASARALVKATVIGTGSTAFAVFAQTYLYGGSGDDVSVSLGGAPVKITSYSDVAVVFTVDGAGGTDVLLPAGIAAGEQARITILSDYGVIEAGQVLVAS